MSLQRTIIKRIGNYTRHKITPRAPITFQFMSLFCCFKIIYIHNYVYFTNLFVLIGRNDNARIRLMLLSVFHLMG